MPLKSGNSHEIVSSNVKELVRAGHSPKQAVAIALTQKRKFKKMAEGGLVNADFDSAGTPEPVDAGDEDMFMTDKPSAAAPLDYKMDNDEPRDIVEINEDGDYDPDSVANPMTLALQRFAEGGMVNPKLAKVPMKDRFAMGGLVDDPGEMHDMLGSKPSEDMSDGDEDQSADMMAGKADLEHSMRNDYVVDSPKPPKDLGISEEAMEAIRNKRMKRKNPLLA